MTIYAIGDIQGCFTELQQLLKKINFSKTNDTLWFAGDLINRGPESLETLRFIKSLGDSAITVLGNHDLHALAVRAGIKKDKHESLSNLLNAPDADELFNWLRCQPLIHHDPALKFTIVHAGIPPDWDLPSALNHGQELHQILSSDNYLEFLEHMYGDHPDIWQDTLSGWDRLRYICNAFTRIRYCYPNGRLNLSEKNSPEFVANNVNDNILPWFEVDNRKTKSDNIIFGHWSTLGLRIEDGLYALDTGCLWGKHLTALKIDSELNYSQVKCPDHGTNSPNEN
ncbi:MAG: symmetrical bis(5'-nucleosyl)-tetraphosphatase [Gammaproteobacteria bacterium]